MCLTQGSTGICISYDGRILSTQKRPISSGPAGNRLLQTISSSSRSFVLRSASDTTALAFRDHLVLVNPDVAATVSPAFVSPVVTRRQLTTDRIIKNIERLELQCLKALRQVNQGTLPCVYHKLHKRGGR